MTQFDVFNGDADGICALHQLRLHEPKKSILITGVKRDISLLKRVNATNGDSVLVLDISLDKNHPAVSDLLNSGVLITYFDHHYAGELPDHPAFKAYIDTSADTCTSLIINKELSGKYLIWAVVAAYGDNLHASAAHAAKPLSLNDEQLEQLCELGTCLNYNGYGLTLDDLFFPPDELYKLVQPYEDPFSFIEEEKGYHYLRDGYHEDLVRAQKIIPELQESNAAVFILPEAKWARRVSGVFGNQLARSEPARAHAILSELPTGGYQVSVRAPLMTKSGADELCRKFPTGGGRKAAAGINCLDEDKLNEFVDCFKQTFP